MFDHGDGIGSGRNARARHDFDALAWPDCAREIAAGSQFAHAFESRAWDGDIRGTNRKSISCGAIEGRIVAIRADFPRQDTAKRLFDFNGLVARRPPEGSGDLDHFLPCVSIRQHAVHGSDPGGKLRAIAHDSGVAFGARRNHANLHT